MGWLFLGLFNMHPPAPKRGFLICNNWLKATTYAFLTNYSPPSNTFHCTTSYLDKKKNPIEKPGIFFNACSADPPQSLWLLLAHIHQVISTLGKWRSTSALALPGQPGGHSALLVQLGTSWVQDMALTLLLPIKQKLRHDSLFQKNNGMIQRYYI